MAATFAQIRSATYSILNDTDTSNVYTQALVDQTINDQYVELCASRKWSFLRSKKLFAPPADTTLSTAITTASTTVVLASTTNLETSGAIWIDHDVIDYASYASTTLSGVTNIGMSHAAGVKVYPLVVLPTDYGRQPVLLRKISGASRFFQMNQVDEMLWDDITLNNDLKYNKYCIVNDESDTPLYLRIEGANTGDVMAFYYNKKPTTLSSDADTTVIPDPWALKILPKMSAVSAMYMLGDNLDNQAQDVERQMMKELMAMRKYYGQRDEGATDFISTTYTVRPRRGNPYTYR